jgi:trimeric autotransporter adhesin
MPLQQVEQYVQKNKHLPNIPSAEQVVNEGIDLAKMNAKLLEKVEELTLYIIEQDKRLKALEEKGKK